MKRFFLSLTLVESFCAVYFGATGDVAWASIAAVFAILALCLAVKESAVS